MAAVTSYSNQLQLLDWTLKPNVILKVCTHRTYTGTKRLTCNSRLALAVRQCVLQDYRYRAASAFVQLRYTASLCL